MINWKQISNNSKQFLLVICSLVAVICILAVWTTKTKSAPTLTISNKATILLTIADTAEKQARGYSGHAPIGFSEGMLFVFTYPTQETFWMNEMLFDLDFIYEVNGKVDYLVENVRAPIHNNGEMTYINSPRLFDAVLEVKSGFIKKYSIQIGDPMKIY